MDYKKLHEDTLKGLRTLVSEGKITEEVTKEICSDFKVESEDERIKNRIISYLKQDIEEYPERKKRIEEMLTYLEKQKEQKQKIKVKIPKFRVGDIIQHVPLERWDRSKKITSIDEHGYNYDVSHLGDTVSGGSIGFAFENEYELVEQKPLSTEETELNSIAFLEQTGYTCIPPKAQPVEKQDYSGLNDLERAIHRGFLAADVENVPVTIIKETAKDCLAQIKPTEWSDTKELVFKDICKYLKEEGYNGWVTLLEALHSGEFKQPVAWWSEREEKDIQEASDHLRDYANNYVQGGNSKLYIQSLADRIESLSPQPSGNLVISFMNYLDEHRPDGKMCLSNGECGDINKAFKDNDWAKIIRYVNKYQPHWKPSEEQMEALKESSASWMNKYMENCELLESLYNDLSKL